MNSYLIQLRGQVDVTDLNPLSPHQMTITQMTPAATWVRICTDQSGLIGIMRHLHNLGLTIRSVHQEEQKERSGE
jgi:hypothetical protein